MTEGPNPQRFKFGPDHYVFGDEAGGRIQDVKTAWENTVLKAHGMSRNARLLAGFQRRSRRVSRRSISTSTICATRLQP